MSDLAIRASRRAWKLKCKTWHQNKLYCSKYFETLKNCIILNKDSSLSSYFEYKFTCVCDLRSAARLRCATCWPSALCDFAWHIFANGNLIMTKFHGKSANWMRNYFFELQNFVLVFFFIWNFHRNFAFQEIGRRHLGGKFKIKNMHHNKILELRKNNFRIKFKIFRWNLKFS